MEPPVHHEVAARFSAFLAAMNLSRAGFAKAVDGAIEPQSLFSLLNGHRRPSRALAVLIERSFGFRADYLLHGTGEAWTKPAFATDRIGGAALAPDEAAVVDFLRSSPQNARDLEDLLVQARSWDRLLVRLQGLWDELESCAGSEDALERSMLPDLAKLVLEDLHLAARRYEQLAVLLHRQRVHRIADGFIEEFFRDAPAQLLQADEASRIESLLRPVLERRRAQARWMDRSLERLRERIEALCNLEKARVRVSQQGLDSPLSGKRALLERLARCASGALRDEAMALASRLDPESGPAASFSERLEQVLGELSLSCEEEIGLDLPRPVRE